DLSGQYVISGITKTAISGGFHYEIVLSNPNTVNSNWQYVNDDYTLTSGALLNKNTQGINLDGSYTIATITADTITLAPPSSVNNEWNKLSTLPNQNTTGQDVLVRLDGST
ncbi:TPA: hypothetical protein VAM22_003838, partial [Acinetobacter baumannii]|nr:hypothetical protein [Acinetobacter baumannii]